MEGEKYRRVANKILKVCLDFSEDVGTSLALAAGEKPSSPTIANTATASGVNLYIYSAVLLKEMLRKRITDDEEFKASVFMMERAFADELKMSYSDFSDVVGQANRGSLEQRIRSFQGAVNIGDYTKRILMILSDFEFERLLRRNGMLK